MVDYIVDNYDDFSKSQMSPQIKKNTKTIKSMFSK